MLEPTAIHVAIASVITGIGTAFGFLLRTIVIIQRNASEANNRSGEILAKALTDNADGDLKVATELRGLAGTMGGIEHRLSAIEMTLRMTPPPAPPAPPPPSPPTGVP